MSSMNACDAASQAEPRVASGDLGLVGRAGLMHERAAAARRVPSARSAATAASFRWCAPWLPPKISSPSPARGGAGGAARTSGAHRVAGVDRATRRKVRRGLGEADADALGEAPEAPVRRTRRSRSARAARPARGGAARRARSPPKRSRRRPTTRPGRTRPNSASALAHAACNSGGPGCRPPQTAPPHLPPRNQVQRAPSRRDERAPRARSGCRRTRPVRPRSVSAAPSARRGEDVPPGSPTGDQDVETGIAQPDSRASASSTPDLDERHHHRRAAVRHERQRQALGRQHAERDADVQHALHHDERGHPEGQQRSEVVGVPRRRCGTRGSPARRTAPARAPAPSSPSSSPMTAKMKSVCAAGR